jgi:regulator of replication initiation timing
MESDNQLKENVRGQLLRLTNQLKDLEELKDELEPEEYEEQKADTLKQIEEFKVNLEKLSKGNMSLVDELGHLRLALQAAISKAFSTPESIF